MKVNIDIVEKANLNDFQRWLSFKFEVPTLWINAFNYSYSWIYFVWFICWNSSWLLYRHWSNNVIAQWLKLLLKILMKKRQQQHKPSQNTRERILIARCLGYTVTGRKHECVSCVFKNWGDKMLFETNGSVSGESTQLASSIQLFIANEIHI